MATLQTITKQGCFDSDVVAQINANFSSINAAVIGPNLALINDVNGALSILLDATATAVNGLEVTNAATGNPVILLPGGAASDTNVGLTLQSKGTGALTLAPTAAGGTIVIGKTDQTGAITVGSSSGTETVAVGNGAGAATVNLANVTVAGATVNVASAVTGAGITDTTTIAGGNAAATGVKVVNIAAGTPGTSGNNRVTIGGGATSAVTLNAVVSSYQAVNYIATESGSNNDIAGALLNAGGVAVTLAAGLRVVVKLGHSLQAGANAFVFNAVSKSIKSHFNVANDIGTAYAATGFIDLIYDGTQWLDMSQ